MAEQRMPGSADRRELKRFAELAGDWWDETGPMAPLHKLNPMRLAYIRDQAVRPSRSRSEGARLPRRRQRARCRLRRRAAVRAARAAWAPRSPGIDLVPANLEVARAHAQAAGLEIVYREIAAEQLAAEGARFDLVCVMEVVEHVADVQSFLAACGRLVRPGGGLVLATLNRTLRSFALGIVAAEYILGWLPRGTHRWSRFLRPSEVARALRDHQAPDRRPDRRRLRSAARPLSPEPGPGRQLHAVRRARRAAQPSWGGSQGIWPTLMPSSRSSLASARARLAVDAALLDLAVVHLARFLGEARPTWSKLLSMWSLHLAPLAAAIVAARCSDRFLRAGATAGAISALLTSVLAADRAADRAGRGLLIIGRAVAKPGLEGMAVAHSAARTESSQSYPRARNTPKNETRSPQGGCSGAATSARQPADPATRARELGVPRSARRQQRVELAARLERRELVRAADRRGRR